MQITDLPYFEDEVDCHEDHGGLTAHPGLLLRTLHGVKVAQAEGGVYVKELLVFTGGVLAPISDVLGFY